MSNDSDNQRSNINDDDDKGYTSQFLHNIRMVREEEPHSMS